MSQQLNSGTQIVLKWNNHSTIINDFQTFLTDEVMVDVTLSCDGKKLKAHKLVLSAGSSLFRSLISENPCQHPIIILPGIKYSELKTIIDFIYYGEATITTDNLDAVIKCAEFLKVKVLGDVMVTSNDSSNQTNNTDDQSNHSEDQSASLPADQQGTTSHIPNNSEASKSNEDTTAAVHKLTNSDVEMQSANTESNSSDVSVLSVPFTPHSAIQSENAPNDENVNKDVTMPTLLPINTPRKLQNKQSVDGSVVYPTTIPLKKTLVEESIVETSTTLLSNSLDSCKSQEEQSAKQKIPKAPLVVIEDFGNLPISVVERMILHTNKEQQDIEDNLKKKSRSRSHSRKRHQSSPDRSKKEKSRSRSRSNKRSESSPDHVKPEKHRSCSKSNKRGRSQSNKRGRSQSNKRDRSHSCKRSNSNADRSKTPHRSRSCSKKRQENSPNNSKEPKQRGRSHSKKRCPSSLQKQNRKSPIRSTEQNESILGSFKMQNQKSPDRQKEKYESSPSSGHPKKKNKSPGHLKETKQGRHDHMKLLNQDSSIYSDEKCQSNSSHYINQHQNNTSDHSKELPWIECLNHLSEQEVKVDPLNKNHHKSIPHNSSKRKQTPNVSKKPKYQKSSREFHQNGIDHSDEEHLSSSDHSYMELTLNNSDNSDKKHSVNGLHHPEEEIQYPRSTHRSSSLPPLKPTPNLPVVLCEMISIPTDGVYSVASPAFPSGSEKKEKQKTVKKRPYARSDSADRKVLYKIENTPSGRRFYSCRKCSFKTLYSFGLKRHVIAKHAKNKLNLTFKCDQCSYAAPLKQTVKEHKAEVHGNIKQYHCSKCSYMCAQKSQLRRHIENIHESKKSFKCVECDFYSTSELSVTKHTAEVHENAGELLCDFCTYTCAIEENLSRHMRLAHENEEPSRSLSEA